MSVPLALYVHVPFCETKCTYCNFNTYERIERLIPDYLGAVKTEAAYWATALDWPQTTSIFFGGGTPSWLPPNDLVSVLDAIRCDFRVDVAAEITAEVNPGDANKESLSVWRNAGINRLSFGVQSFHDDELAFMTRRHSAAEAVAAVTRARDVGFENVSVDLMYGLPNQTLRRWEESLEEAISLGADHMSLYALSVEEGTALHRDVAEGRVPPPDSDTAADMYELAEERLGNAGYVHYEISNWAKLGYESRHNLAYWLNQAFLGLGPGAHSYLDPNRFWNINSPLEYIRRLQHVAPTPEGGDVITVSPVVDGRRELSVREMEAETVILKLRLSTGLDELQVPKCAVETLREFEKYGMIERQGGIVRLTSRGRLLSNELFERLLPEQ